MFLRRVVILASFIGIYFLTTGAYGNNCRIPGMADFCGAAGDEVGGQYIITFKKVELSTDGTNFITVGESSGTQINIASMSVGSSFRSFAANANIPAGTYNYLRVTMSRIFSLKGVGQYGGKYYYTSQETGRDSNYPYFPIAASCATWNTNQPGSGCPAYQAVSIKIPGDAVNHHAPGEMMEFINNGQDARITKTLPSPIVVVEGKPVTIRMKFYTQGMIGFKGSDVFPMPPAQNVSH